MDLNQYILDVIDTDGEVQQVEVLLAFESETTKKQYIVYTKNEIGSNDRIVLYASTMLEKDQKIILEDISDQEWLIVKDKMREVMHSGKVSS